MSVKTRLAEVAMAEAECMQRRKQVTQAWQAFKHEGELAATPGRIVAGGLIAGFAAGLAGGGKAASVPFAGKLIDMLMDTAFANLGAAIAAGAAAAAAESEYGSGPPGAAAPAPSTTSRSPG